MCSQSSQINTQTSESLRHTQVVVTEPFSPPPPRVKLILLMVP